MLIIDGAKYEAWIPEKEVEEFQPIVKEHVQDIFGNESKYIEARRLKSKAGIGSVPDGFVIIFGDSPQWHIVEVELSSHQLYDHIVNQVGRFINGIKNPVTQKNIIDTIYQEITGSKISKVEVEEAIGSGEIHKFLTDLISLPPILTIIIEKKTQELEEAINLLKYSPIKIVEFQTFRRVGAERVHTHLFEPIYIGPPKGKSPIQKPPLVSTRKRVTAKDLIDASILKVGQIVYGWHHNTKYEGKVLNDGSIELLHTGEKYPSLNAAVYHVKGSEEDAWRWWLTTRENGSECVLDELRKEYRTTHP